MHRFKADSVHYVTPTEDNLYQTEKMKSHGIFREVQTEVGQIIGADVNHPPDRRAAGAAQYPRAAPRGTRLAGFPVRNGPESRGRR